MSNFLSEAFKELDALNEDTFELTKDGLEKLDKFYDGDEDVDEVVVYTDDEFEDEEEQPASYVGKIIEQCNTCKSLIYKDRDEITIDEETGEVDAECQCPYCHSEDGFVIIGKVCLAGEEKVTGIGEDLDDNEEDDDKEKQRERLCRQTRKAVRGIKRMREPADESINEDTQTSNAIAKYQRWVDYDMKKYNKISNITQKALDKAGLEVVKDDHGDYEVIANTNESFKEGFNDVSITTDAEHMEMTSDENGKITVTTEPTCKECEEEKEVIEPLTNEEEVEVEKRAEEDEDEIDVDFDEFDEETFESLTESFLKNTYGNVKSFKVNDVSSNKGQIVVEGKITFDSDKQKATKFVFEGFEKTKKGKVKLVGENLQFTNGKKAFTITGEVNNKKLVVESLNYNYRQKNPITHKADRIYGTIKKA